MKSISFDKEEKKRLIFVLCLTSIFLTIFVNIKAISWAPKNGNTSVKVIVSNEKELMGDMTMWPNIINAVRNGGWSLSNDSNSLDALYLRDCWEDSDWLRMYADPYCTYLWMRVMQHEHTKSLDLILAVITNDERDEGVEAKHNQNGGMRCTFSNYAEELHMRGYWKPCTTAHLPANTETFTAEIIAFYIDRILGFYRTPVVTPRYFSDNDFDFLSNQAMTREDNRDDNAKEKLDSVLNRCGSDDHTGAEGAMVGWTNFEVETLDRSNHRLKKSKLVDMFKFHHDEDVMDIYAAHFNVTNDSLKDDIEWAMENIAVNLFAILMGNTQKFRHSVFIMKSTKSGRDVYGPLLYIDNDRSSWQKDIFKKKVHKDHPITKICKFPKKIATRILLLDQFHSSNINDYQNTQDRVSLGKLVKECADNAGLRTGNLFTDNEAYWLDERVHFIAKAINECVHLHGVDYVFIDEPWTTEYDPVTIWSQILSRFSQ